jgi:hypothetical protein
MAIILTASALVNMVFGAIIVIGIAYHFFTVSELVDEIENRDDLIYKLLKK